MDEIWKDVPDSDYSVSNMGRIASRKYGGWLLLKPASNGAGYFQACLCTNGIRHMRKVHTLVAEAFLPPKPTPSHQINHKNGIKADNRADNLEWVTQSENTQHAYSVLGHKAARGERASRSKVTEADVREIRRRRATGEFCKIIALDYGISGKSVARIGNGKEWAWLL